jgi:vacuolar-type H+-ATPase subunit F/Vma7
VTGGVVVIGRRVVNLPFRLAGASVRTPAAGEAAAALLAAQREGAELVLLAPECAAELPPPLLLAARRAGRPLLLVLPGAGADAFDVAPRVRRALGLEA